MIEDVAEALDVWMPAFGLPPKPPQGTKDLKGQRIRVSKFLDEETVRFFFPRRSLIFQQRMVRALTSRLRQRGAKIESVQLTIEDFAHYLDRTKAADTPAVRYRFATAPQ